MNDYDNYKMDDIIIQADFLQEMEENRGINSPSPQTKEPKMASIITDSQVFPYNEGGATKAFASITLNGDFVVRNIRIVEGRNGLFLSFPSKWKENTRRNIDISFPITASLRAEITHILLAQYENGEVVEEKVEEVVETN